ncbi:NlpC/P60 family protein [Carnimonas bestiolae]|uniref:NlpC/P60 family protein n=1 Tax=Carnimonas bestiolae TaxID=3402172 RepID=UPI003EDBB695
MRRLTGCCCVLLLLSGCASQQTSTRDTATYTPHIDTSSALIVAKMAASQPVSSVNAQQIARSSEFTEPTIATPAAVRKVLMKQYAQWQGTRYRLGGVSHRGIDCSALMQHIFRDGFDHDLPRTTASQVLEGDRVLKSHLRPGDLVFFRPYRGDRHVGVYVGNGSFMHASTSRGVMISRLDNVYWARHYWTARRALDDSQLAAVLGEHASEGKSRGYMNSADY